MNGHWSTYPLFLTFTDNALSFTMKYTAHPERTTAFTKTVQTYGGHHALIDKDKPWNNGFIERSNRTDNDEFFSQKHFASSEERQYLFRLWEMEYNSQRPHQGINNKTPLDVFRQKYSYHAAVWA